VAEGSGRACAAALRLSAFATSRHVVAYVAVENEVDPGPLVAAAERAGKTVYYPRVEPAGLVFLQADPRTFRPGAGRVPEPREGTPLPSEAEDVLFVVPGLAFDVRGVRLGRGAGCYDRALGVRPGAVRLGLAFEFQMMPALPTESWDVRMHAVATDARLLRCEDDRSAPGRESGRS